MSGLKDTFFGGEPYFPLPPKPKAEHWLTSDIPQGVADEFERLAFKAIGAGREHYSADAILHLIRWFHHVEQRETDFKCNDHWTSRLARWFVAKHPEHEKFFELRKLRSLATGE
jgi:hypothetical protein